MFKIIYLVFCFCYFNVKCGEINSLNIAVSSNFLLTFKFIAYKFENKFLCKINICSDSTSNLYNKIKNKAPFDIFISADSKHPILLENFTLNKRFI